MDSLAKDSWMSNSPSFFSFFSFLSFFFSFPELLMMGLPSSNMTSFVSGNAPAWAPRTPVPGSSNDPKIPKKAACSCSLRGQMDSGRDQFRKGILG